MDKNTFFTSSLEYFMYVYRMRSITDAARAIPMSYQGLKKAMRMLEKEAGARLFEPGVDNDLVPTEAARVLYRQALQWFDDINRLDEAIVQVSQKLRMPVHVVASSGISGYFGYDVFEDFEKEFSELSLKIKELPDPLVDDALTSGEYKLALTNMPFNETFETVEIATLKCCAWVNSNHKYADRHILELSDFNGQTVLTLDPSQKIPNQLNELFEERGVTPKNTISCSEIIHVYISALQGKGIGIGVQHIANALSNYKDVVSIKIRCDISWTLGISWSKSHTLTESELAVIEFLKNRAKEKQA